MLRSTTQSSSSSDDQNLNGNEEMSVLERQRAMFQRLYHHSPRNVEIHSLTNHALHNLIVNQSSTLAKKDNYLKMDQYINGNNFHSLSTYGGETFGFAAAASSDDGDDNIVNGSHTTISNSSLTPAAKASVTHRAAAMERVENKASTKKRKAGFDKEKEIEGEAQSEVTVKSERENSNENSKASEVKKPDYIHVRARRGEATDSHSLAERARREKISKKMKYLQELVPGCNKVTGKAGMLDEIINYVQSLQKQVEFLSMKLAALNPRLDFNVDNLFAKELPAYMASFPSGSTTADIVNATYLQLNQLQQTVTNCSVDIMNAATQMMPQRRDNNSTMSIPEMFLTSSSCLPAQIQQLPTWDSDWQSPYNNVNFH